MLAAAGVILSVSNLSGETNIQLERDHIFNLEKDIIKKTKFVEKYNWITTPTINYSKSYTDTDNNGVDSSKILFSLDQEIYRFGGIKSEIEAANLNAEFSNLENIKTKNEILENLYKEKMLYEKNKLKLKQLLKKVENANLIIETIKENFTTGDANISDLNQAILDKIALQKNVNEINRDIKKSTIVIKNYTPVNIDKIIIEDPIKSDIKFKDYIDKNIDMKKKEYQVKIEKTKYDITKSKMYPSVSVKASYNKELENEEENSYTYQLNVSLPISLTQNTAANINKIEYLKSKREKDLLKKESKNEFDKIKNEINYHNELILETKKNIVLYKELADYTEQEYKNGYKTKRDFLILKNNVSIQEEELSILEISSLEERIELYFNMIN